MCPTGTRSRTIGSSPRAQTRSQCRSTDRAGGDAGTESAAGADFVLTVITRDPTLARAADDAGVNRIGIDIERLGKSERQRHLPAARISDHQLEDLGGIARSLRRAAPFARVNPLHPGSPAEVEGALARGARVLMLPYFKTAHEVSAFTEVVGGRAEVILLLETAAAAARLHEILTVPGFTEVMVGLNDLHLDLGLANQFELLGSEFMDAIARQVHAARVRFGFGGLGRVGDIGLPVASDLVYAQFARLGGRSAWIARSFFPREGGPIDLAAEVARVRARLAYWFAQPPDVLDAQRDALRRRARALAARPA